MSLVFVIGPVVRVVSLSEYEASKYRFLSVTPSVVPTELLSNDRGERSDEGLLSVDWYPSVSSTS